MLHARQYIYYGDAATGETLVADVRRFVSKRPEVWTELIYFKKTGETDEGEKYERVEALNFDGSGERNLRSHGTCAAQPVGWAVQVSPSPSRCADWNRCRNRETGPPGSAQGRDSTTFVRD